MKTKPKFHPFLILCLSMAWTSIAAEALHFTDGRLSKTGDTALMGISFGLILFCLLNAVNRALCDRVQRYLPPVSAFFCLLMLLPFAKIHLVLLYGISCGMIFASALTGYLPHVGTRRRMVKIGFSAGVFTTAVYPFGLACKLLLPYVPLYTVRIILFSLLAALATLIWFLHMPESDSQAGEVIPAVKYNPVLIIMALAVITLVVLNHLLNSGVLEQNGGTVNAPFVFFVNVALRLPMCVFMGWLADRGR